jgi:hypothetical protein
VDIALPIIALSTAAIHESSVAAVGMSCDVESSLQEFIGSALESIGSSF